MESDDEPKEEGIKICFEMIENKKTLMEFQTRYYNVQDAVLRRLVLALIEVDSTTTG